MTTKDEFQLARQREIETEDRAALFGELLKHVEAAIGPIAYPEPEPLDAPLTREEIAQVAGKAFVTVDEAVKVLEDHAGILPTRQERVFAAARALLAEVGGDGPLLPEPPNADRIPDWQNAEFVMRQRDEAFLEQLRKVEAELAEREARRQCLIAQGRKPRPADPTHEQEQARRRQTITEWHLARERLAGDALRAPPAPERDRESLFTPGRRL